jgi:alpha-glucosidase
VQDPVERNLPGLGLGRDPERTPMQWNAAQNAGFTSGEPWLPLPPDYRAVNVAAQRDAPHSLLRLYREAISLRRSAPALQVGRFEGVETGSDVLAYIRRARRGEGDFLIALNLGSRAQVLRAPLTGAIVLSTHLDRWQEPITDSLELRPDEGVIVSASGRPGPG